MHISHCPAPNNSYLQAGATPALDQTPSLAALMSTLDFQKIVLLLNALHPTIVVWSNAIGGSYENWGSTFCALSRLPRCFRWRNWLRCWTGVRQDCASLCQEIGNWLKCSGWAVSKSADACTTASVLWRKWLMNDCNPAHWNSFTLNWSFKVINFGYFLTI